MWKASAGHKVSVDVEADDDWETDPDFVNDVSEKDQRWGAKTVEGSGRQEHFSLDALRAEVSSEHRDHAQRDGPSSSHGYGGRYGVETDRMDKSAVGHEYSSRLALHSSQTDGARGFGGRFGVESDRVDKAALGFEYKAKAEKHVSQKDYAQGFGGKFGVQSDRVDKVAHGWEHKEKVAQHESQTGAERHGERDTWGKERHGDRERHGGRGRDVGRDTGRGRDTGERERHRETRGDTWEETPPEPACSPESLT
ncbi:uncharacterized protein LOC144948251 [Lampetra fluviatilis]